LLWDVESGRLLPASANPAIGVQDLRYTDGGRRLIGRADRVTVWDPDSGRAVQDYADVPTVGGNAALSPDGRLLAGIDRTWYHGRGSVRIWDAITGQEVHKMSREQRFVPTVPVFTPDGRRLIATDTDGRIVVCDQATGQTLGTLTGHSGWVYELIVSLDGRRVASVSPGVQAAGDNTIRVWDLATSKEVLRVTPVRGERSPRRSRRTAGGWRRPAVWAAGGSRSPSGMSDSGTSKPAANCIRSSDTRNG
jgi:WD40 repeat protein